MRIKSSVRSALIFGGAGFIGSNLARKFLQKGVRVTIVDGLLPGTGGHQKNIQPILSKIKFSPVRIEKLKNIQALIRSHDLIVDAMALTSHVAARTTPLYDLELNAASHLHLISALAKQSDKRKIIIYLGSRVQYGSQNKGRLTETSPMTPDDIQGVHKLCAESYYRIASKLNGLNVISLRFPNCFGLNQPAKGADLGLVGNFIRDLSQGKTVVVYGGGRNRELLFCDVLTETIYRLVQKKWTGFHAFNVSGEPTTIAQLAHTLSSILKKGRVKVRPLPHAVKVSDMGNATLNMSKLKRSVGQIAAPPLSAALALTAMDFLRRQHD
jgi:UDP-glucose 4-epimerase